MQIMLNFCYAHMKTSGYLLADEVECDKLIILWARDTIVNDLIAQNSDEDFQI